MGELGKMTVSMMGAFIIPLICGILMFFISGKLWGPGVLMFAMSIATLLIAGFGSLIINLIIRAKKLKFHVVWTLLYSLGVSLTLLYFQNDASKPNELKKAILPENLDHRINATLGKIWWGGFDFEIFVKLESDPESTELLLNSKPFKEIYSAKEYFRTGVAPHWLPNLDEFMIFQYDDRYNQIIWLAVHNNKRLIYGYYLKW